MNEKFLKRLRKFCKIKKISYDTWLKAYKIMPPEKQKAFKETLIKDMKLRYKMLEEREEAVKLERFTRKSFHG